MAQQGKDRKKLDRIDKIFDINKGIVDLLELKGIKDLDELRGRLMDCCLQACECCLQIS